MNIKVQMIVVEPTIRMPDWRSASPKKRNTRRPHTSRTIWPVNLPISPVDANHSRGIASSSPISDSPLVPWQSLDHQDLRVRGEKSLREHVVEGEDRGEGEYDGLVDGAADALGAAGGGHALVAADDRDDRAVDGCLQHRAPQVGG